MAEDTKGKGTVDTTATTEANADAVKKLSAAQRDFTTAVRPNIAAFSEWNLEAAEGARLQERLTDVLREQWTEIKKGAVAVGSLQSQFKDLGSAATGFLGQLKQMISLTEIYKHKLHDIQAGQQQYLGSISANTSKMGQAAGEATKRIDAQKAAMKSAASIAKEYVMNLDDMERNMGALNAQFGAMAAAYGNQGAMIHKLGRTATQFSKFMEVDFAEAQDLLNSRIQGSTLSLEEVRKELLVVARSADDYSIKLEKMGEKARQAGYVTKSGFLSVLKEINQMFSGGMNTAAEGFAKTTSAIFLKAKEMGFTPTEAKGMAASFGKVFGDMARFDNIFGARVAQKLGEVIKDIGQIQDERLRKRMEPYAERAKAGTLNVVDLKGIADAARGSSEGMRLLIRTFATSGLSPDVMRTVLGEAMGPGQQHLADALSRMIQKGDLEGAFNAVGVSKEQAEKENEAKRKEQKIWEMSFEEFMKQGHTTENAMYNAVIEIHRFHITVTNWFKNYPILMAAIMGGASLLGGVGGGLLAARGGAAALTGMKIVGAGGATVGTLAPAAAAGGVTAAGVIGGTLGVGGAFAGGAILGHKAGQYAVDKFASDETKHRLGKGVLGGQAGLGDVAGSWMARKWAGGAGFLSNLSWALSGGKGSTTSAGYSKEGMEMLKNVTRIRGVLTDQHKQQYKQLEKQIEWAEKNWEKLDDNAKEAAEQAKRQRDELGKFIKQNTTTDKDREKLRKEDTAQAIANMAREAGIAGVGAVKKGDRGAMEQSIMETVAKTVKVGTGMTDIGEVSKAFMASGAAQQLMAKGFSAEEVKRVLDRELLLKHYRFSEGYQGKTLATGGAEREQVAQRALQELMTAGKLNLASGATLESARGYLSGGGAGAGGTPQLVISQEGGKDQGTQEARPDAQGNVEMDLPHSKLKFTLRHIAAGVSSLQHANRYRGSGK